MQKHYYLVDQEATPMRDYRTYLGIIRGVCRIYRYTVRYVPVTRSIRRELTVGVRYGTGTVPLCHSCGTVKVGVARKIIQKSFQRHPYGNSSTGSTVQYRTTSHATQNLFSERG